MAYTDKLRVVYGDYTLGVHGEGFDYIFSYAQGGLESIVKNGYEWLYRCPKPTFWRALTDNDRGSKFHIKSGSWLSADMFIDCKGIQVIMDGEEQKPYAPDILQDLLEKLEEISSRKDLLPKSTLPQSMKSLLTCCRQAILIMSG